MVGWLSNSVPPPIDVVVLMVRLAGCAGWAGWLVWLVWAGLRGLAWSIGTMQWGRMEVRPTPLDHI